MSSTVSLSTAVLLEDIVRPAALNERLRRCVSAGVIRPL